jgi:hypothetical protein
MGKLLLSMIIGALVMVAAEKWQSGDLSAGQMLAAVQNTGQALVSVRH